MIMKERRFSMTSRELLYVKTIADEKSITGAARKLYVAQPSLSQALQKLEDQIGTPLFKRTTGGLTLTYAGERYYYMACQILKMYENFEIEVSDINNLKTGRIHFGITNHLGMLLLPQTMKRFQEICPFVEVQVAEDTTAILEMRLLSRWWKRRFRGKAHPIRSWTSVFWPANP